jgi:4-amino-4-deoxy-L-arabinose transferase-like glycosyltransferase
LELFNVYQSGVEEIIIILIGAILRFYRLAASWQFLGDQGRDALIWQRLFSDYDLPFIGPITSVGGFFLGPLYYWLMAPFYYLAGKSPLGPVYATAALGTLTVWLIYLVAKKLFGRSAAVLAAGLYSLAAVPVAETRSAWNPNLMPLASLGIIWGFYQAQATAKKRWLFLSGLSLGIALQLHYMIIFLGLFLAWQLLLVWRRRQLRSGLLVWLGIIVILMLPLLLFEIKNHWLNSLGLVKFLTQHHYNQPDLWRNWLNLRGRSEEAIGMLLGFGRNTNVWRTWLTRLFLLGVGFNWLKRPLYSFKLVSLWLLLTILAIAFYNDNIPPYYLGFIFPAVFILAGYLLNQLKGKWQILEFGLILVFLWFNFAQLQEALSGRGNYLSVQKTGSFIYRDVLANHYRDFNLTLLDGTKDYKAMAFRYIVEKFGSRPLGIDAYEQTQVLYIISPYRQSNVLGETIWEINSLKPATVSATWEFPDSENIYKIEKL